MKDLNCLGRDLSSTIIVDNSPHSYVFQPDNAVPIGTFIDDMEDQELLEVLPQLLQVRCSVTSTGQDQCMCMITLRTLQCQACIATYRQ